jgi:hypothetical protein
MTLEEYDAQIGVLEREWVATGNRIRELTALRDQLIHEANARAILSGLSATERDCIVKAAALDARAKLPNTK